MAPREGCRRELVSWLGATLLRFRRRDTGGGGDGVELVISWSIIIGIGGEAESCVAADVRMPGHCTAPTYSLFNKIKKRKQLTNNEMQGRTQTR